MQQSELNSRVASYLQDISARLSNRPEEERSEILRNIEDHIQEALRQRAGRTASIADLDYVLKTMDAPDSYGPPVLQVAPTSNVPMLEGASLSSVEAEQVGWHQFLWTFPAALCFFVLWFMSLFVAPKFAQMYKEMDLGALPILTQCALWTSNVAAQNQALYILVAMLVVLLFRRQVLTKAQQASSASLIAICAALTVASFIVDGMGTLALGAFAILTLFTMVIRKDPKKLGILNTSVASVSILAIGLMAVGLCMPLLSIMARIGR
jgi:hypothetical protein